MSDDRMDGVGQLLAKVEDETPEALLSWIGGVWGALASLVLFAVGVVLFPVTWVLPTRIVKLVPLAVLGVALTFFQRHRLAAHFEKSRKLLDGPDADTRNRGLVELMINARRGTGEHRRIAVALVNFLGHCPSDDSLRKVALAILTDGSLKMKATEGLAIPAR